MHSHFIGLLFVLILFILILIRLPIGVALGISGFLGLWVLIDYNFAATILETLPFSVVSNYSWVVFPMFILVGSFVQISGLSSQIFKASYWLLGRMKGGLYLAVIAGSAGFSAASGSTMVNAMVFTRIAYPEMVKYGYSKRLSLGSIAAAGTFAAMIPPSLTMVIYAIITEQSIGKMLLAGVIPGILSAVIYAVMIIVVVRIKPHLSPKKIEVYETKKEKKQALTGLMSLFILIFVILGGIYSGVFPPSQAGVAGAMLAFMFALIKKGFKKKWVFESLKESVVMASSIFIILIGGAIFSRMVSISGIVQSFTTFMISLSSSKIIILLLISLLYLVLGSILDSASMMIITLPFVFPIILQYQINPIWFGVIFVKLIEIAVITPPIGLNLFAVYGAVKNQAKFKDVVVGILPFLVMDLFTLGILIALPGLSLYLPGKLMGT